MTYEIFKKVILERLSYDIADPKHISIQTCYKNNECVLDGLVILENGCNIAPTLYLNRYYEQYRKGSSFQDIYEQLLEFYEANRSDISIDVSFYTDFRNIQSKIAMKLIHYEKNREFLKKVPHVRFLDLAIVFYCLMPVDNNVGNATILILNSHMELWNISLDTLFQLARENSPRILPARLENLNTLLEEYMPVQFYSSLIHEDDPLYPMFVLTNREGLFGAACMLYDQLIHSYAEKFQSDFYILPSSIHEVILIPSHENEYMDLFADMVREVNQTQVAADEILTDHAYYYSREKDTILM